MVAKIAILVANLIQLKSLKSINVDGSLVTFEQPKVMGIINITPDSFYRESSVNIISEILKKAHQMVKEGATILDIGGYSSRPGAEEISIKEEISRIKEPIRQIRNELSVIVSIDTFRVEVAESALNAGANIVNDISGGNLDARMFDFIAANKVPYIAMHMKGTPQTMVGLNKYDDLLKEVLYYFSDILEKMNGKGVHDVIIDPGFGFAKNIDQNFELLNKLELLQSLNKLMIVGLSRKSMIHKTLSVKPEDALNGTTVLNTLALYKGTDILRVHDVLPAIEAIELVKKVNRDT